MTIQDLLAEVEQLACRREMAPGESRFTFFGASTNTIWV